MAASGLAQKMKFLYLTLLVGSGNVYPMSLEVHHVWESSISDVMMLEMVLMMTTVPLSYQQNVMVPW